MDLATIADNNNIRKDSYKYKECYDVNFDKVIDIYDIVKVANEIR